MVVTDLDPSVKNEIFNSKVVVIINVWCWLEKIFLMPKMRKIDTACKQFLGFMNLNKSLGIMEEMKSASPQPPLQVSTNNGETNDLILLSATPTSEAACILLRMGGPVCQKPRHHTAQRWRPYHRQAWHPGIACHKQQGNCRASAGDSQGEWHHPEAPRVHTSWPNQEQAPRLSNLHQRWCTLVNSWSVHPPPPPPPPMPHHRTNYN